MRELKYYSNLILYIYSMIKNTTDDMIIMEKITLLAVLLPQIDVGQIFEIEPALPQRLAIKRLYAAILFLR